MKKSRMRDRLSNSVNAGSMADIAFLLLIFFLVTTTIAEDKGILVKLPPWTKEQPPTYIVKRNVFRILVRADDKILAREEEIGLLQLKGKIKNFIANPSNESHLAKDPKKAVVSLQNDRSTSYTTYIGVYNEIKQAYNELRTERAIKEYGKAYDNCSSIEKKNIRQQIPLVISEAEPTDFSN